MGKTDLLEYLFQSNGGEHLILMSAAAAAAAAVDAAADAVTNFFNKSV